MKLGLAIAVGLSLIAPSGASLAHEIVPAPAAKPNIIVIYMDDVAVHDGRLWKDPARTPTLAQYFVDEGVDFSHAIGEDSLCCPARGNLLTGLHTHNNRVYDNDARLFDPSVHIGQAMRDAGYSSMFIGKYMNKANKLSAADWAAHDAGWTELDVMNSVNGLFYNYPLHTRQGELRFGDYHSTRMVAERASMHIRETAPQTPVFAVLSFYNLHAPNTPMPEFDYGSAAGDVCNGIEPWISPSFNEADVSDKPASIRALPLLSDDAGAPLTGWPMENYCREMLGIDWAAEQVIATLADTGRLDNTLLVFTADNGMGWGAHRWGQKKNRPYTSPVPLYMWWPSRWSAGVIDEPTTNIDLAPTFCDLADCQLGPFASGQPGPDGVSLVPLLDGDVADLGRDALLEAMYLNEPGVLDSWVGLRTTPRNPLGNWHYVEHITGERELYDMTADPDEMDNVAGAPQHALLIEQLSARLAELRIEGRPRGAGRITFVQDTRPNSPTDFSFIGDLGSFQLDDDRKPGLPRMRVFRNLGPGVHTFAQLPEVGWTVSRIKCTGGAVTLANRSVIINLNADQVVRCVYVVRRT